MSRATLFRKDNYNTVSAGIPTGEALAVGEAIPTSYVHTTKPSWFGDRPWPWCDPSNLAQADAPTNFPAGYRYAYGANPPSGGPDTAPPSAPTGLASVTSGTNQINLSWNSSLDNVGVTGYLVERQSPGSTNFSQIGTAATTAYSDTGLASGSSYTYRVRATDAAGNLSQYSGVTSATTLVADFQPPTAPANLAATAASSSQINVSWTASTDNVGVTGYRVERSQGAGSTSYSQVGTPASTSFSDTGLAASTVYNYRVRAADAAGNLSGYSSVATATTANPPPDLTPPSVPTGVVAVTVSSNQINVGWAPSTDNVGVTGYLVERAQGTGATNFTQVGTPASTSFSDTGLFASTAYNYRVRATDAAGNLSAYSSVATATTSSFAVGAAHSYQTSFPLTENPISEGGRWIGGHTVGLDWQDCKTLGNTVQAAVSSGSVNDDDATALLTGTWGSNQTVRCTYYVSGGGSEVEIRLRSKLSAHNCTGYELNFLSGAYMQIVSWDGALNSFHMLANQQPWGTTLHNGDILEGSVSNKTITAKVNGVVVAQVTDSTWSSGAPGMGFFGTAGNIGFSSFAATDGGADPEITGQPQNQTVIAGQNGTFTVTADGLSTLGYQWRFNGSNVGINSSSYTRTNCQVSDSGGSAICVVTDAAGSVTSSGATLTVNTNGSPDQTPPTVPTGLAAITVSSNQINLNWTASTDNVGVTGYLVERAQGTGSTSFTQVGTSLGSSFNDSGLTASTVYNYRVRATDAAGNLSAYSSVATASTTSQNPPSGLVAAYGFDEGTGSSVADLSGNGNNGTISGATWTNAGRFGSALSFGAGTLVTVADAPALRLTTALTLEAWVTPTALNASYMNLIFKSNGDPAIQNPCYVIHGSNPSSSTPSVFLSGAASNLNAPSPLSLNTWTHLATTYDGATARLYVNGAQVASQAQTGPLTTSTDALTIGGNTFSGENWIGLIDEVRIYNRALSPSEIQADMNTSVSGALRPLPPTGLHVVGP